MDQIDQDLLDAENDTKNTALEKRLATAYREQVSMRQKAERAVVRLSDELSEKKGIWMMDNGYSSDRVFLCKEIADGLRLRGHWVPKEPAGPDIIMAIFQAIEPK